MPCNWGGPERAPRGTKFLYVRLFNIARIFGTGVVSLRAAVRARLEREHE